MSEPAIPLPAPERDSFWNPEPARCSEKGCNQIIDAHPASRADNRWEGWCQSHGIVLARYPSTQKSEYDEEETP